MMISYFNFRIKQFFRLLNYESDFSGFILVGLLCIIFINLNNYLLLFTLPILLIHFKRKDILFLKNVFPRFWEILILIEYHTLYLGAILLNIHYKIDINLFYPCLIIFLICFIHFPTQNEYAIIKWNFIPNILFEWKSFLRKKTFIFIIYFIGLVFSAYHPFTLILMGILYLDFISNIYTINERKDMLEAFFKKYHFLYKLKYNIIIFNITLLPTYILYLCINFSKIEFLLYYFAFTNLYLLLILTRKYSIYHHKVKENSYNSGIFMKYLISSFFIVPTFPILKENYIKSINLIKSY